MNPFSKGAERLSGALQMAGLCPSRRSCQPRPFKTLGQLGHRGSQSRLPLCFVPAWDAAIVLNGTCLEHKPGIEMGSSLLPTSAQFDC